MKLTPRDYRIFEFLNIAPSNSFIIHDYLKDGSLQVIQRRLKRLNDYGYIKRADREDVSSNYVYYMDKKPKQIQHIIKLSQLYVNWLSLGYEILQFKREKIIGKGIKPDAQAIIKKDGELQIIVVEVDIWTNPNDKISKYTDYYYNEEYKEVFPVMPTILFITDKKLRKTKLEIIAYPLDFYSHNQKKANI